MSGVRTVETGPTRRRLASATSVLATVALLAACSGGGAGDAVEVTEANTGLPVVGENIQFDPNKLVNDGRPIALEWWAWDNIEDFQRIADEYQEIHPNVDITVVSQPWDDYWTKLPLELQSKSGPTLFAVHNSQHANLIQYMAPYDIPVEELTADYSGVEPHIIDGQVSYLDLGMMSGGIFYNTDMWAAAGLTDADIPETWDELREVANELTIRDGDRLVQAGFNFNDTGQSAQMGLAYQLGANLFEADQRTPDVDNAANLEVVERVLDIYADGSGDPNFGTSATDSFGQGQSAMIYAWGWYQSTLASDFPDISWDVFPTPVPEAGQTPYAFDRYNGESTFGINAAASAEELAVAQDFLRFYLTNGEELKNLALAFGIYPAYKPIADDPEFEQNPAIAAFHDIDRYIWPGPIPAVFEQTFTTMWQDVLYNGVDPQAALTSAQSAIAADVARTGFTAVEDQYTYWSESE